MERTKRSGEVLDLFSMSDIFINDFQIYHDRKRPNSCICVFLLLNLVTYDGGPSKNQVAASALFILIC